MTHLLYTHTNVHKNNNTNIIQIYVATYTVYTKIQKNKKQTNSLSIVPSTYRVRRILRRILLLTSTYMCTKVLPTRYAFLRNRYEVKMYNTDICIDRYV